MAYLAGTMGEDILEIHLVVSLVPSGQYDVFLDVCASNCFEMALMMGILESSSSHA